MKLTTLLKKHFDIEECTDVDSTVNREVYTIWVYEKGEDCEPLLILKDAQDLMGVDGWLVGNIYFAHQLSIARSTVYKILEDERAS